MHDRRDLAAEVAATLFRAELAVDAALRRTAALAGALPAARRRGRIAATVGQPAIDGAAEAVVALTRARAALVAAHEDLAAVHRRLGLGVFASGPIHDKPDETETDPSRIQIVPDRTAA